MIGAERRKELRAEYKARDSYAELSSYWHEAVGELLDEVDRLEHALRNAEHAATAAKEVAERRKEQVEWLRTDYAQGCALLGDQRDAARAQLAKAVEALRESLDVLCRFPELGETKCFACAAGPRDWETNYDCRACLALGKLQSTLRALGVEP